jgi:hypothetical protein
MTDNTQQIFQAIRNRSFDEAYELLENSKINKEQFITRAKALSLYLNKNGITLNNMISHVNYTIAFQDNRDDSIFIQLLLNFFNIISNAFNSTEASQEPQVTGEQLLSSFLSGLEQQQQVETPAPQVDNTSRKDEITHNVTVEMRRTKAGNIGYVLYNYNTYDIQRGPIWYFTSFDSIDQVLKYLKQGPVVKNSTIFAPNNNFNLEVRYMDLRTKKQISEPVLEEIFCTNAQEMAETFQDLTKTTEFQEAVEDKQTYLKMLNKTSTSKCTPNYTIQ